MTELHISFTSRIRVGPHSLARFHSASLLNVSRVVLSVGTSNAIDLCYYFHNREVPHAFLHLLRFCCNFYKGTLIGLYHKLYHFLLPIMRQYLSVPSSVASEQLFSRAGVVCEEHSNRLQGGKASKLL